MQAVSSDWHSEFAQDTHALPKGNGSMHSASHGGAPPTPMLHIDVPHTQLSSVFHRVAEAGHRLEVVIVFWLMMSAQVSHAPPAPLEALADADADVEATVP